MSKELSVRHERFCEAIVEGKSATDAYLHAGYKVSKAVAAVEGHRMLRKPNIEARIAELRARDAAKSEFTRDRMVAWLVSAITTPVGQVDENHPLAMEVTRDYLGDEKKTQIIRKRVKMSPKQPAADLLCQMMGWKAPEKLEIETGAITLARIEEIARNIRVQSPLILRRKTVAGRK